MKRIIYPKSLKDIPLWRQRQLAQDLLWFSRFSPVERLQYIDREWEEIQKSLKSLVSRGMEPEKEVSFLKLIRELNRGKIRYLVIGRRRDEAKFRTFVERACYG